MTAPGFRPTHVVPRDGLPAWETPDPSRPTVPLDALLPVQLVERRGDWGQVMCANGWSAWVDGRLLVAVPHDPPAAGAAPSRARDPRQLLDRAEDTLERYRRAVGDLAEGRLDGESFRDGTRGLRIGLVVDGESLWLYDTDEERWLYCDGTRLSTYAAPKTPTAAARTPPPPEPTRVVPETEPEPAPPSWSAPAPEPPRGPEKPARTQSHEPHRPVRETEQAPEGRGGGENHEPTRLVRPVTPDE